MQVLNGVGRATASNMEVEDSTLPVHETRAKADEAVQHSTPHVQVTQTMADEGVKNSTPHVQETQADADEEAQIQMPNAFFLDQSCFEVSKLNTESTLNIEKFKRHLCT